jgi:hypothetical protein
MNPSQSRTSGEAARVRARPQPPRPRRNQVHSGSFAAISIGLVLTATPVSAQHYPHPVHQGFWIGFGAGYASAAIGCDSCSSQIQSGGPSGFLRLGGTVRRNLLVGAELNARFGDVAGTTTLLGQGSVAAYLYPFPFRGFYLKGGLGVAIYHARITPRYKGTGLGLTAGAGYDLRVGRSSFITPVFNIWYGDIGNLRPGGSAGGGGGGGGGGIGSPPTLLAASSPVPGLPSITGVQQTVIELGLGVAFY